MTKQVIWLGSSKSDLTKLPDRLIDELGHLLNELQEGNFPTPAATRLGEFGAGVCELAANDEAGTYRLVQVINLPNAIYVLHAFQKKSKSGIDMPPGDKAIIKARAAAARTHSAQVMAAQAMATGAAATPTAIKSKKKGK